MEKHKFSHGSKHSILHDDNILQCMEFLSTEAQELFLPKTVHTVHSIPAPLQFHQKWVAPNLPLLIKGGCKTWRAIKKWNRHYIAEKLRDKKVSVSVTPDGLGDAIHETVLNGKQQTVFVLPEEKKMNISQFYNEMAEASKKTSTENGRNNKVLYIQKQNSNLTEEFPELLRDIDQDLHWAKEAFNSHQTAINLWIGDERAVSSLHKDPFENIYCVISGYKDFILLPPTDRPWLPYKVVPIAQYVSKAEGHFDIKLLSSESPEDDKNVKTVPWIDIDPLKPNLEKYPLYSKTNPLHIRVHAGDMLYIPSLWFHHVRQSHRCIAVNFWYDMIFDIKYAYYQLLDNLSKHI